MQYVADNDGVILSISFGAAIECSGRSCTEYTGSVPTGYTSMEEWYALAEEHLYQWRIVDGELIRGPAVPEAPYDRIIQTGTAEIEYKYAVTSVTVKFPRAYIQPPAVFVSSVFSGSGLVVMNEDITTTQFTARLQGGFSETGTRSFNWLAIGPA